MHGTVVNARAVLHFAGRDIGELKTAFVDTVTAIATGAKGAASSPRTPTPARSRCASPRS